MKARPMLVQKNTVTHIAVSLVTKLPEPCAPNTLPEEFPPNAAPASAHLPCWTKTSPITAKLTTT